MTHSIEKQTIDKLITMLGKYFHSLESLRQNHHNVDLSVEQLTVTDYYKVEKYAKLTEGWLSKECFKARTEFLVYMHNRLTTEARRYLRDFEFSIYHGLDNAQRTTFSKAFGMGDNPRPSLVTSMIELWQFVITVDPTKKDLIPATLQDYARHLLYYLEPPEVAAATHRPSKKRRREQKKTGIRLFDNTVVTTPRSVTTIPMLDMVARINNNR